MGKTRPCECEHISHLDLSKRSPNGNPNHKYGVKFFPRYLVEVKTPWGTYTVCNGCSEDCLRDYKEDS